MSDGGNTLYRAAIFTAIPIEYQAVCAHLTNLREEKTIPETACERGEFSANNRKWDVILVETGAGTTQAARETILIIERFKPMVVVFVGIAGGVKDVKIGDVVVASKVYNYEGGRSDPFFQSRPQAYSPTRRIQQRAVAVSRKDQWLQRLKEPFTESKDAPNVIVAPIASGNQVVASTKAVVLQLLRSHFNDAIAEEQQSLSLLEEFNRSLPDYIDKVKTIRDSLDQRMGFSTKQHRNALTWLDTIEKHIEKLLHTESSTLMAWIRTLLAAIQRQIRDLKPELKKFLLPSDFIKSPRPKPLKENDYEHAIAVCDALLADLEQWPR